MENILQYIVNGLLNGGVYALLALGIVVIYKSTGVFNFAVGQMVMLGPFIVWTFLSRFGLPLWWAILLALVSGGLIGLLIERLVMRPLIGQSLLSSLLATLSLAYLLTGLALAIWGPTSAAMPQFLPKMELTWGNIRFATDLTFVFLIAIVIFILLALLYMRSRYGLLMRAVAESHQVAQARGVNMAFIFGLTWFMAGIACASGGILVAYRLGISQFIGELGLLAIPAVLLGGLESIPGALIGGLIIGVVASLAGTLMGTWLMQAVPYAVLLVVLLIRPYGLFGLKRIERI